MNRELYNNLANAVDYFRYGDNFEKIKKKEKLNIDALTIGFRGKKEKANNPFFILSLIAILGIIFLTVPAIIGVIVTLFQEPGIGILFYVMLLAIGAAPVIFLMIVAHFSSLNDEKINHEYKTIVKPKIDASREVIKKINTAQEEFAKANSHLIAFLPKEYQTLTAATYMFISVSNGRADTLKEAMNIYEEQLHRWKLEDSARQAAEIQGYVAMAMDKLNALQTETNRRLEGIEMLEFMNYVNGKK